MITVIPLAHQGGWDEILIFGLPVLLYAAVRLWERYRGEDEDGRPDADDPAPD